MTHKGNRWGYIDRTGAVKIAFEFDHTFGFREGLGRIVRDGHVGFISGDGAIAIASRFSTRTGAFSEGMATAQCGSTSYGYIDPRGKFVIAPVFSMAYSFSCGMACIGQTTGENEEFFGFIDSSGYLAIKPQFPHPDDFSEGLAAVHFGKSQRYIDTAGNVVGGEYKSAGRFMNGFADVTLASEERGIIDRDFRVRVLDVDFLSSATGHRFLAARFPLGEQPTYGFLDCEGIAVFPFILEDATPFSGDLAAAKMGGEWGYLDREGRWAIEPQFKSAESFSDGLAKVETERSTGYIDESGRWAFDMRGFVSFDFAEGLAAAYLEG